MWSPSLTISALDSLLLEINVHGYQWADHTNSNTVATAWEGPADDSFKESHALVKAVDSTPDSVKKVVELTGLVD